MSQEISQCLLLDYMIIVHNCVTCISTNYDISDIGEKIKPAVT